MATTQESRSNRSLLEQLPEIVRAGKRQAERIMEGLEARTRVALQTRELVTPAKDTNWQEFQSLKPHAKAQATVGGELALREGSGQQQLVAGGASQWFNRLIYGDNLLGMAALLAGDAETPSLRGKIDLIYIDPPFDSKADYRTKITLPGGDVEQKPTVIEQFAYSDTWADGTASYLAMIVPRLYLMRELLSERGSIYVHVGPNVASWIEVALHEVFGGTANAPICWKRVTAHSDSHRWGIVHDMILWRAKTEEFIWSPQYEPYDESYIESHYSNKNPDGRRYTLGDLSSPNPRPNLTYVWRGCEPPKNGWRYELATMEKLFAEGKIELPKKAGTRPRYRRFLDESEGSPLGSVWSDIFPVNSQAKERIGYDTQKPEALVERIIKASTSEGSLIADFFGGSGTTAAVAEKLGRRWITSDLGKPACMIMRKRLIDQNARPFFYQAIGDYQVEAARSTLGKKFRVGDLAQIVLGLYGALPLDADDNPNRNLGKIPQSRTLVFVDSPQKLTGLATLKKAQELRGSHLGGWEKVVVLGWNFTADIGEVITNLNDAKLEVLVIPPDLLDRLKKSGGFEKLKTDFDAQRIRFSSLQYVTVKPIERKAIASGEVLTVELDNYVLLSPDALNLEAKDKERLQAVVNRDPLALVEYWSVDPDYDGEVFRSVWQDYRGNTANDDDELHVVREAVLNGLPVKSGSRRVCVRVVDVFGFEAEVVKTV
jgi:adenine-specific DNA-methyltransferase